MPKKVTKKVECDRKVCAEKIHRGKNVCDGELVFEDSMGEVHVECRCICHAIKGPNSESDKFKSNPFAKKYKKSLNGVALEDIYEGDLVIDAFDNASQVKSWSKHERANTIDKLAEYLIAFSLGGLITLAVTNL